MVLVIESTPDLEDMGSVPGSATRPQVTLEKSLYLLACQKRGVNDADLLLNRGVYLVAVPELLIVALCLF